MTPAIPDGYEIATERREGLMFWNPLLPNMKTWEKSCPIYSEPLLNGVHYIAPIRLRIGENYRCRNGQETGLLVFNDTNSTNRFYGPRIKRSLAIDGKVFDEVGVTSDFDIVAHIPKEKKMEPKIRYQSPRNVSQYTKEERQIDDLRDVVESMPADSRLTEAGNKITDALLLVLEYNDEQIEKARLERENEIKAGDWFRHKSGSVDRCEVVMRDTFCGLFDFKFDKENCTKIPGPPEFIAFLESGVKK